jgi:hypothetical protein
MDPSNLLAHYQSLPRVAHRQQITVNNSLLKARLAITQEVQKARVEILALGRKPEARRRRAPRQKIPLARTVNL